VGFVVDKVALGQVFSEYFGFPCQFIFHLLLHTHHHLSCGVGHNKPKSGSCTKWIQSHPMREREREGERERERKEEKPVL
jgi:hypothetical protein